MSYESFNSFAAGDRRRDDDERTRTVFRPCAVEVAEGLYAGLVRNVSENGAQIEILDNFKIGENVVYDDGVRGAIEGRILWRKGDLYGVRNSQKVSVYTENYFERGNSYRSIRIPVSLASTAWVDGLAKSALVSNISLSGAQLDGQIPEGLTIGTLCTLSIYSVGEVGCTVRWIGTDSFGVKFSRSLTIRKLTEILCESRNSKVRDSARIA